MSEKVVAIIQQILDPKSTKEVRNQCEEQLKGGVLENASAFIQAMMENAQKHPEESVRSFCVVQIRKNLSAFSDKNYPNQWENLDQMTQQLVKTNLFECLLSEQKNSVRHQVCDTISEIGGSMIQEKGGKEQWTDLVNNVFKLIQTGQTNNVESGLIIVSGMLAYNIDDFLPYRSQLVEICKMGLDHSDQNIKLAAVECVGSFVESAEPKESKPFEALLLNVFNAIWVLMEKDETVGQQALQVLVDLAETEPKFFKAHFKETFTLMHKIVFNKNITDEGIKKIATEIVITIGERIPKLYKDNQQQLQQLLEMIFMHMIDIDQEITAEWSQPEEGYNDDIQEDADLEVVRFGMGAVDRLISAIGQKVLLPILSNIVQQSLNHNDWRYQNAAIMALSQVGEYLDSCKDVEPILNAVIKYSENPNPKIRYAVCHCIGQIADDMQPDFQQEFHGMVMPMLQKLLDDPVPRVVSHSAAALTNFVEGMNLEQFKIYVKPLLSKLCSLLVNSPKNISIVKENSIAAIAACSEAAGKEFTEFYQEVSAFLFGMLESHQGKEYRQLRGQLIECLTLIAHAVEWTVFQNQSDKLINFMIMIQEGQLEDTDPQKSYLLSGWQRLCMVMKKDFAKYLPRIVPSLFKLIENVFNDNKANQEKGTDEDDKKINIQTYDTEEAEVAINMLSVIMDELKELYAQYVERTTQIVLPLVNYSTNEDIRKSAAKCLPSLVICAKSQSNDGAHNITRAFIKVLTDAVEGEYAPDVIVDQVMAMKECIDECGKFLSQQEITEFSQRVFKFLMDSDKRKMQDEETKKQEDVDEDEVELLQKDLETEEDLQVAIAELLGVLFKTHQELSVEIANSIYDNILPKALDPAKNAKMHKFGIFLVDDMIEFLGYQFMASKWLNLLEALIKYSTSKECYVRQAAVYGIGIFAEKSVGFINESNQSCLVQCLNTLKQVIDIPQGDEKAKVFGHARDNAVAALGKIIKHHSDKIDAKTALDLWLGCLPITFDKNEGFIQHEMLADLIIINPQSVVGAEGQSMSRVIELFALILDGKANNETVTQKITQCMQNLKNHPQFANSIQQISTKLTDSQKSKLEATVK